MNPETPPTPREETEMRLTALLMGELPPEEAAALQARLAAEPELAALYERLCKAMELLREATALPEQETPPAPVQLSSERRERLLAHFKKPAPILAPASIIKKPRRDWSWAVPLSLAAAVIVVIGGGLMMPAFSTVVIKGHSATSPPIRVETYEGPVGTFGPVGSVTARRSVEIRSGNTSNMELGAGVSAANRYAMLSTPAPQQYQIHAAVPRIQAASSPYSVGSTVGVPPVPALVTSSLLDAEPAVPAKIPPAEGLTTWNLGKVQVANSNETTANFQLPDGTIPEDQKRPFTYGFNETGVQTLSGSNTFTGGVTVDSGTVAVAGTGGTTFTGAITGNTRTKDKTIRREFPLDRSDAFNTVRVDAAKQRLMNTHYFSKVETNGMSPPPGTTTINGGTVSATSGAIVDGSAQTATTDPRVTALGAAPRTAGADFDAGTSAKAAGKEPLTVTSSFGDTKITTPIKDQRGEDDFWAGARFGRPALGQAAGPNQGLAETQLLQNEFSEYPAKPKSTPRPEDRLAYAKATPAPAPRAVPVEVDTLKALKGDPESPNAGALTAGNRSGNLAISANAIDALLFPVSGKGKAEAPAANAPAPPPNAAEEPLRTLDERGAVISGVAAREKQRRADYETRGREAITSGEAAMKEKDYEKATAYYKNGCDIVPNTPKSQSLYNTALKGLLRGQHPAGGAAHHRGPVCGCGEYPAHRPRRAL